MRAATYVTPYNLAEKTASWLTSVRSNVAPRPQLRLEIARAALLVVDMNHIFAHPQGHSFLPATVAITPRIAALVEAWRARGRPLAFTQHAHAGPEDAGMFGLFYGSFIVEGSEDAALLPEFLPRDGEAWIRKNTYDAFLHTDLEGWLRARGVEQLVITGVLTQMCCETTARSAFNRGFEVYLPVDGMATTHEARHLCSLTAMGGAVGLVTSTDEILALCSRSSS